MGGDHGPAEVVPGALDYARSHPDDQVILVGDAAASGGIAGDAAGERLDRRTPARSSAWTSIRRSPCARRRTRRSSSRPTSSGDGEADAVVTAGHTGAGMAAAVLRLGRLPGVDRPALAVQMITDCGPIVLLDIGANPDSTPENLAQYAQMGAIFAERVLGVARPARRAALDRRGEGQGRRPDPARDRAARRVRAALRGQRRGQGPDHATWPTWSSATPCSATSSSSSSRACRRSSSTCGGPSSGAAPGPPRLPADAPGHRPDPRRLRLREGRRLAAARRQRAR